MLSPKTSSNNEADEILYWKSKALSLEYENKMLHKHIKHLYTHMADNCNVYYSQNEGFSPDDDLEDDSTQIDDFLSDIEHYTINNPVPNKKKEYKIHDDETEDCTSPNGEFIRNRENEMKFLYGKDWRKILGMETCVQLTFDLFVEKDNKASFWPVVPINL